MKVTFNTLLTFSKTDYAQLYEALTLCTDYLGLLNWLNALPATPWNVGHLLFPANIDTVCLILPQGLLERCFHQSAIYKSLPVNKQMFSL